MLCVTCEAVAHAGCTGVPRGARGRGVSYRCRACGGEGEAERCRVCARTFRTISRRVKCEECDAEAHAACSGLTRESLRRGDSYRCQLCGELETPPSEAEVEERVGCLLCGVTLRRGAGCARCVGCGRIAHKKCAQGRESGGAMSAPFTTRRMRPDCQIQSDSTNKTHQAWKGKQQRIPLPLARNERCPACSGKLRKTQAPFICRNCNNQFHIKCSEVTRDALEEQRRRGAWECGECRCRATRSTPPQEAVTEATPLRGTKRLDGLKILQWNYDGLATNKDELEEFMKREGIHLAMIQETKLGLRDVTPGVRGYVAYRKDREGSGQPNPELGGCAPTLRKSSRTGQKPLTPMAYSKPKQ